jgi:glycosyltransferase involved in cell wall biosynthesis
MAYLRAKGDQPFEPGKVTIVTATYNRPHILKEAIESVRKQTYSNWEQIVVSDGRDPRVEALGATFNEPRLRVFNTRRFSVMGNYQRNYALKYATGEFVLYLDDDNIIYPQCLETMVKGFTADAVGYVVCPIHYGDGIMAPGESFRHEEIDLLNFMVRRKLVLKVWGQPIHYSADFRLIDKIRRISQGVFRDELIGHHR